jgi:hypothetical protein
MSRSSINDILCEKYPILKTDCKTTRAFKELARQDLRRKIKKMGLKKYLNERKKTVLIDTPSVAEANGEKVHPLHLPGTEGSD